MSSHLDAPYVWLPPICLDIPLYVWMIVGCPPYVWVLLCLDVPCMSGQPHMFGDPLYVWMMFRFPLYIYNTKSMLFHTKGMSICANTFGCPHMFGYPFMCYLWFPNGNIASIYIWKLTAGDLEWSLYP